jgi:hypothetical protein
MLSALLPSVRPISFPVVPYQLIWMPKLNVRAVQTGVERKQLTHLTSIDDEASFFSITHYVNDFK